MKKAVSSSSNSSTTTGTMTISVMGKQYTFQQQRIPFNETHPDPDNPRYSYLAKNGKVTQEEMLAELEREAETKDLRKSIKANGGLIEPIVVIKRAKGGYLTVEGNRRWQSWNVLYEMDKEKWGFIDAYIVPSDMPERELALYLGFIHVQGKHGWSPASKADYALMLRDKYHYSEQDICDTMGFGKATMLHIFTSVETMTEYGQQTGDKRADEKFSHMMEFTRMPKDSKTPDFKKVFFESLKDDKLKSIKDIRQLPAIVKNEKALKTLQSAKGPEAFKAALSVLNDADPTLVNNSIFARMKEFTKALGNQFVEVTEQMGASKKALKAAEELHSFLGNIIENAKKEQKEVA